MANLSEGTSLDAAVQSEDRGTGNYGQMLAVRHVAKMLGVHESTVRVWADLGVLESYRIGARQDRRIPIKAVLRILEVSKQWPRFGPSKSRENGGAQG